MKGVTQVDFTRGLREEDLDRLQAGEAVELSGRVISLRDASAARLAAALSRSEPLPVSLAGEVLYAVGPSPPKPGQVVGSAGPTTAARMARYFPALLGAGACAVIGKGELHGEDMAVLVSHRTVYFAAVGGMGALLGKRIREARVAAYHDLGPEALYSLQIEAFPAVVIIDREGRNYHEIARARWRGQASR